MIFNCETIDVRDKAGTVTALGVQWSEARTGAEAMLFALGKGLFLVSPMIVVVAIAGAVFVGGGVAVVGVGIAAVCIGLSWFCARAAWRVKGKPRDLFLHLNGDISSTTGVGGYSDSVGNWRAKLGDINSFEAEELRRNKTDDDLPYTHGVRLIMKRGKVLHIAKDLEPDQAVGLAVALTIAWQEMLSGEPPGGSGQQFEGVW